MDLQTNTVQAILAFRGYNIPTNDWEARKLIGKFVFIRHLIPGLVQKLKPVLKTLSLSIIKRPFTWTLAATDAVLDLRNELFWILYNNPRNQPRHQRSFG